MSEKTERLFASYAERFYALIPNVMASSELHARWLNTLSYLENCGARKIAASQHPTAVQEEMLKHAAEEFRHAHYLKQQIGRISPYPLADYALSSLVGGIASLRYLSRLDLLACRYLLEEVGYSRVEVKMIAYTLVTYAIELRAGELYGIYESLLREKGREGGGIEKTSSRVTMRSILLEEKEHLQEMEAAIDVLDHGWRQASEVCRIEGELCEKWLSAVENEMIN